MFGPLSIGTQAAKAGYERFGVTGAVAGGLVGAGGYVVAKRALDRARTDSDAGGSTDDHTSGTSIDVTDGDGAGS